MVLLDEPTSGMDPEASSQSDQIWEDLSGDKTPQIWSLYTGETRSLGFVGGIQERQDHPPHHSFHGRGRRSGYERVVVSVWPFSKNLNQIFFL